MNCEKCGGGINPDEVLEHAGHKLCEDCYLDLVAVPKTCDPWAVHTAKNMALTNDALTSEQQKIFDLIKNDGPLTAAEICRQLSIDDNEFQRNFATLRHMELARGFKKGDQVYFTLFRDQEED